MMLPIRELEKLEYNVNLFGITRDGQWYYYEDDPSFIADGSWIDQPGKYPVIFDFCSDKKIKYLKNGKINNLTVDIFFPVLHGKNGEDGTVQGLFELLNIPYIGCGVSASAVCMDKALAKQILNNYNIPQADYIIVRSARWDEAELVAKIEASFGFPVFVKPCNSGSSCGVSRVGNASQLHAALVEAFNNDSAALIEQEIKGRELECAVLKCGEHIVVANAGEIIAGDTFYTYNDKYINGVSRVDLEPDISEEQNTLIKSFASQIFDILGCKDLARVDFFVEDTTGRVVFNEINTMPGLTSISMYPKMMEHMGIEPQKLFEILIKGHLNTI